MGPGGQKRKTVMKDKIMTCIQCGNAFVFTVAEQARFIAHHFDKPKRCQECRKKKSREIEISEDRNKDKKRKGRRRNEYDF